MAFYNILLKLDFNLRESFTFFLYLQRLSFFFFTTFYYSALPVVERAVNGHKILQSKQLSKSDVKST